MSVLDFYVVVSVRLSMIILSYHYNFPASQTIQMPFSLSIGVFYVCTSMIIQL